MRCEGEDRETREFAVYAPVALAGIGRLPGTIEDRSIIVPMVRATRAESRSLVRLRKRRDHLAVCDLRRKCARWAADHRATLAESDPAIPEELDDRAADCWRPLLAIADQSGPRWAQLARTAAVTLSGGRDGDDESRGVRLLRDVRTVFDAIGEHAVASQTLADALARIEEAPWGELGRTGRPVTPVQLARLLAPFGIRPANQRLRTGQAKGYARTDFEDAWSRYGCGTVPPSQPSNGAAPSGTAHDPASVPSRPGVPGPLHSDGTLGHLGRAGTDPENGAVPRQLSNGAAWDGGTAQERKGGQDAEPCPAWFAPEDTERREVWRELDPESRQAELDAHARQAAIPATCYPDGRDAGERVAIQAEGSE